MQIYPSENIEYEYVYFVSTARQLVDKKIILRDLCKEIAELLKTAINTYNINKGLNKY
jgi:hypothetical protein